MRFKSRKVDGFQVFAVTGVNTVSFAITATDEAKQGLLGFAVERALKGEKPAYRPGFKVFEHAAAKLKKGEIPSTKDHPVQSLVWDDFTARPGSEYEYIFHPLRGSAKKLDRSAEPVSIKVETEELFSDQKHDIFFNRGVASSQAYAAKFGNKKPNQLPPKKRQEALDWLSRSLDDAILKFIDNAKTGDTLLGCFYEFRYLPVVEALAQAVERGVDVRVVIDAKENGQTDKETGKKLPAFPRADNLKTIKKAKFPMDRVIKRAARKSNIHHNKFMVLLKGKDKKPSEVWTGSANISDGGIFGQTNVGHWVRDAKIAKQFVAYWNIMSKDPGGKKGDDRSTVMKKNKEFLQSVEAIEEIPASIKKVPAGVSTVFSPRSALEILDTYFEMVDQSKSVACITLAFGVAKQLKDKLMDNTNKDSVVFMLLEKEDKEKPKKPSADGKPSEPFVKLTARNNVYAAFGSFIDNPVYRFARETNTQKLQLNQHVAYIHSKFLLMDPLGDDPIVVTGSANFSTASTNGNDENMLIIRGDRRVADIYFTEFNRLFNHYYFRAVQQKTKKAKKPAPEGTLFLTEDPDKWLSGYQPGNLRSKRVEMYANMDV